MRSTIVAGRLPVAKRHDYIDEPYLAGTIGDRLLHNGHRLVLKGQTRRKSKASD